MKRLILSIVAILMIVLGSTMIAYGQEIDIELTEESDSIDVVETYIISPYENDIISFWIQSGHSDLAITINDTVATVSTIGNTYSVNLSEYNTTSEFTAEVTYSLDKNTEEFEKELQYNTTSILIKFDTNEIYMGSNLNSGSTINVALQKQTPMQPATVETIPIWVYAIMGVLLVLFIVSIMRSAKSQKISTKKESPTGSQEFFTTKKSLLLEILKQIEKLHRGKKISDETYHKLKDRYKQEAVDTMRKLEDMKN